MTPGDIFFLCKNQYRFNFAPDSSLYYMYDKEKYDRKATSAAFIRPMDPSIEIPYNDPVVYIKRLSVLYDEHLVLWKTYFIVVKDTDLSKKRSA